jgi:hypothetical protein
MAEQNVPGPAAGQEVQQATLKSVSISGTALKFTLGENLTYVDGEGGKHSSKVAGFGLIEPPQFIKNAAGQDVQNPNYGFVQVHVLFEDGYKDIFIVADHLVVKNIHILPVAVVKGPKLVIPGK